MFGYIRYMYCAILLGTLVVCQLSCQSPNHKKNDSAKADRDLYIYAASSLGGFVELINREFKTRYPRVRPIVSLVGTQTARLQLERGAPPGIFLSAAQSHVKRLMTLGKVVDAHPFATNEVSLLTRITSDIYSIDDLLNGTGFSIGVKQVPVGRASWEILTCHTTRKGSLMRPWRALIKTQELSALALKSRLRRGDVESAFVYRSDERDLQGMRRVSLPDRCSALARVELHAALTRTSADSLPPPVAVDWYRLMRGQTGREAVKRSGLSLLRARNESLPLRSQYHEERQLSK